MKVSEREISLHQLHVTYLCLQAHLKAVPILSEEVIPSITIFLSIFLSHFHIYLD